MLHWDEIGDGPPLVLVHGLAASARDWEGLGPALSQAGFRILAVDLPGHGASPKSPGSSDYNLTSLYQSFETWLLKAVIYRSGRSGRPLVGRISLPEVQPALAGACSGARPAGSTL